MPSGVDSDIACATRASCISVKVSSAFESNKGSASFACRMLFSIMPVNTASNCWPAFLRLSALFRRDVSLEMPPTLEIGPRLTGRSTRP
jgi:hypothetical protein